MRNIRLKPFTFSILSFHFHESGLCLFSLKTISFSVTKRVIKRCKLIKRKETLLSDGARLDRKLDKWLINKGEGRIIIIEGSLIDRDV